MLVAWILAPVVLLALCAGCGLGVRALTGRALEPVLVLPVGLATLVTVAGLATASGSTAPAATPLVVVVALAGFALSRPRRADLPGAWPAGAALLVLLLYGAPVLLTGHTTFMGYIRLDDTATWLAITDRVMQHGRDLSGMAPSSYEATISAYVGTGYPLGAFLPLGVAHELTGGDAAFLFAPTLAVLGGTLALTLDALVAPLVASPRRRAAVVLVAAEPALLYGYVQWGGIKEIQGAVLVALTAALVPTLTRSARGLLPLALTLAALAETLSAGAIVWAAPILLVGLLAATRRADVVATARNLGALVVLAGVLSWPSLQLVSTFVTPQTHSGSVLSASTELGNLIRPLHVTQGLGIWPVGDFRVDPDHLWITGIALAALVAVALGGVALAWRVRAPATLAYVVGGLGATALIVSRGSPWVDGKALATTSPAALAVGLGALASVGGPLLAARHELRTGAAVVAGLLAIAVLWGNVLAYRDASPAPHDQLQDLHTAGELAASATPTLMDIYEPYGARHFLREAQGEGASELRRRQIPLRDGTLVGKGGFADVGQFEPAALHEYRSLVLFDSPLASRPPADYALRWSGSDYDLWQRPIAAPLPATDMPLGTAQDPAAVPACASVRALAARVPGGTLAAVPRAPVVVQTLGTLPQPSGWTPAAGDPNGTAPDESGALGFGVAVPRAGRYRVWLSGSTRGRTTVSVDGRRVGSRRAELSNLGGGMTFGTIALGAGRHRVTIAYRKGGLGPGGSGQAVQPAAFGPFVLAPQGDGRTVLRVPAAQASRLCGQRLDWIEAYAA